MLRKLTLLCTFAILLIMTSCKNEGGYAGGPSTSNEITPIIDTRIEIDPADYVDITHINYPGVPVEYQEIINTYRIYVECNLIVSKLYSNEDRYPLIRFENGKIPGEWRSDLFLIVQRGPEKDEFGYGIKDINGDGIPELFLMTVGSTIHEIYSIHEKQPIHLLSFASRSQCEKIDEYGTIYNHGSNGAADSRDSIYNIAEGGGALIYEGIRVVNGVDYTYYSSDNDLIEGNTTETKLSTEEGEAIYQRLTDYEDKEDMFIEFIPLFNL